MNDVPSLFGVQENAVGVSIYKGQWPLGWLRIWTTDLYATKRAMEVTDDRTQHIVQAQNLYKAVVEMQGGAKACEELVYKGKYTTRYYSGVEVKDVTNSTAAWEAYDPNKHKPLPGFSSMIRRTTSYGLYGDEKWEPPKDTNQGYYVRGTGTGTAAIVCDEEVKIDLRAKTMSAKIEWTLPPGVKGVKVNLRYQGPFPVNTGLIQRNDVN